MAYRDSTTVISVPVSTENNLKLIHIADKKNAKSKTSYAKALLERAIEKEYNSLEEKGDVKHDKSKKKKARRRD